MPSTVTKHRPDEATGFQHVGAPANALMARINATRHPNVVKMHDAVDRWVKEANRRGGEAGIEYLARCTAQVEDNRQNLALWATDERPLKPGLEGLTIDDIEATASRIDRATHALSGEAGL